MSPQTFKHFKILELLGKGGMGEVYLALDTTLERKVALKFLPRDLLRDPSAQGRLLDEARSVSRVQHPNIATIHSIEEDGGIFAMCMEYVDGATVKQLLKRGPLALNQVARIGADIAAGMFVAHEQGIVHRDLKPANVMISRRGEIKVMDFGLAVRPERVVNTLGPNTYGTVLYMSPEQARGKALGPASDIFSFGSLLYEMITGRPPFNASNDLAILQSIINTQQDALRDLRRDVPPALEQVVRGCLAKSPEQRWTSMRDIRDELQYVEPTVEAGPRDLISELSSGLSDRGPNLAHRPDNAGRVGQRTPARAGPTVDPDSRPVVPPDLGEGFIVADVKEHPRVAMSAPRPSVPRTATSAASRGRKGASAPVGMVLGPELPDSASSGHNSLRVESTREQWHARTSQSGDHPIAAENRRREIAREAARRARASRPLRPLDASAGPRREEFQDMGDRPIRLQSPKKSFSFGSAVVPALIALLLVVAAGYGLLYRAGLAPPLDELLHRATDRIAPTEPIEGTVGGQSVEDVPAPREPRSASMAGGPSGLPDPIDPPVGATVADTVSDGSTTSEPDTTAVDPATAIEPSDGDTTAEVDASDQ